MYQHESKDLKSVPNSSQCSNKQDMSDEYIANLLNCSDGSVNISDQKTITNLISSNSGDVNDKYTRPDVPNVSSTLSQYSVQPVNQNVNNSEANSDNIQSINSKNAEIADAVKENKGLDKLKKEHGKEYRDSDTTWTEDEDSSSSSSDSDFYFESIHQNSLPKTDCVKTKGELDIEDLPPIEYLKISVGEKDLKKIGKVHAIVTKLVVIKATKDEKPLDIDSVLFLAPNEPLGRIFEVFGPVVEPFYTVLFNEPEDITEIGVNVGTEVYYAPLKDEITSYVFVDALRQQKGSDASWKDNNEPPDEHLDYSDDEQERAAKLKRKGKGRARESEEDEVQIIPYKISQNEKRTFSYTSYTQRNNFETQNSYLAQKNSRNSAMDNRNSIQNNRNSDKDNSNNLDNVPVWISSPPSFLEPKPLPSQSSNPRSPPLQSFQLKQPALNVQNQLQSSNPSLNSSAQIQSRTGAPILLHPKQTFVPRQPPNLNTQQRFVFNTQSPPPPRVYFQPPQRSALQMQQNQPMLFPNMNQHIFGQLTPVGVMSPAPPMSPAMFSPYPIPLPSPAMSPNPIWHPQNQLGPSFANVRQSPPPTAPLTIQIPNFSGPPSPLVRFSAPHNNFSTPPPNIHPEFKRNFYH